MKENDKLKFKKLLFKVAFCTMACDGDIDDREIEEIKLMDKNSSYFADTDLSKELTELIDDFKEKGVGVIETLFDDLGNINLTIVQELLILEVAIRIIYADKRVDDNEKKFFRFLRSKLKVPNIIIKERFGDISDIYELGEYNETLKTNNIADNFTLPDISEIIKVDFNNDIEEKSK